MSIPLRERCSRRMQKLIFSIITVCFNSEKTIERTIKSVLGQTCQDYEYILVDGASTDGTLEIIRRYEPLFQGRMKLISEKDKGIYDAMNKGILASSGELIGIINSDDYYEKDALQKISEAYQGYQYTIIYGMARSVLDGKEVMVYLKNHEFIERDMITHPTCFITKKLYEEFGMYSLEYPYSSDYEFMLRIRNEKEIRFIKLYEIITNFSMGGVSDSVKGYRDTLKLLRQYHLIGNKRYYYERIKSWIAMNFKSRM